MRASDEADYRAYVVARAAALRRTAFLLCGDWHRAEDLVQTTLTALFQHWGKVARRESVDAWVRTTLVRRAVDESRRPWRRERATDVVPDSAARPVHDVEQRMVVADALRRLPAKQRAVVVLRFYEDADVTETARVLGCSEGTVKSHTSRAIASLRASLGETLDDLTEATR
ncbi:MAG TPA: SigE family RNA polymerase sigma factor [Mycobacteriales bacterium]|nr:SigE family RNA polymerase sigma factor [Mycobacteriales bacterium]